MRSLDGLSEHDARRPLTPTGTNLLGLVKHLVGIELGYLVTSVGREAPVLPWDEDGSVWEGADMWARADESREWILDLYRTAWRLADAALAAGAARRAGDESRGGRRSAASRRSATSSCGSSRRPRSTPVTPTSCASCSTGRAAATTTTSTPPSGPSTSRRIQAAADEHR